MAETNPPPSSGGNMKYALIGLLLLGGAAVVAVLLIGRSPPPKPRPKPQPVVDQRPTSLAPPQLDIPPPQPDGGPDSGPRKTRIIYRYVRSPWDCNGNIPTEAAQKVMKDNRAQVRTCYEKRLKVNNTLQGTVSVMLKVGSNGQVAGVQVAGSLHDSEVFSCIRHLANTWRFPAPTGGRCALVSAPFNLTPKP